MLVLCLAKWRQASCLSSTNCNSTCCVNLSEFHENVSNKTTFQSACTCEVQTQLIFLLRLWIVLMCKHFPQKFRSSCEFWPLTSKSTTLWFLSNSLELAIWSRTETTYDSSARVWKFSYICIIDFHQTINKQSSKPYSEFQLSYLLPRFTSLTLNAR